MRADVSVDGGRIASVSNLHEADALPLGGKLLIPGLVDVHVHLREPGFFYKEGVKKRHAGRGAREQTFLVHVRDKIIPLKREDIAFCYTCNEKVTAYTFAGASYPLDKTLEALQAVLPEADFFRANRQFIVARRAVKEIAVWFGSRLSLSLVLETPERIVISKARVPEFKAWLTSVQPAE